MIKRKEYGSYIEVPVEPDERLVGDTRELFANYIRDLFLKVGHLIVNGPNEDGKYTVGFRVALDSEMPDYEKHDFIPGETLYDLQGREYKVDDHPSAIRTHERVIKTTGAFIYPADTWKAEAPLHLLSENAIGESFFYSSEDAASAREKLESARLN